MNVIFSPDLRSAFEHAGLPFPDCDPEAGRIVRFSTNGRNDDCAGWIRVFEDQNGAIFGDWRTGDNFVWQRGREGQPRDAADLAEIRAKADAARKAAEDEREEGYRQAARKALATGQAAEPAKDHAYLSAKQISPHIARERNGSLLIPVFDQDGAIQSVQSISASGQKRFLPGGRMAGGRCWIGEPSESSPLLVAEGFATAATLHQATGLPTCVAFNAGNLRAVALSLREQFTRAKLVLCGDDDRHTQGNPGRTKAIEAAQAVKGVVVFPTFTGDEGTDFNDLMQQAGSEAAKRQILASIEKPAGESRAVHLINGAAIRPEPIDWLWNGWLAAGKLHILAGAPGTGKTTLALALAAALTTCGRWPDGSRVKDAGAVLVWSGEDDPTDTLAPRLLACGADMSRIHFVGSVRDGEQHRPFDPASDMRELAEAARRVGNVRLLVCDPVVSAVTGDSHKNTEVRRALQPLVDLGHEIGAAILGISHFSKGSQGRDPTERVAGSLAFGALARVVLAAAKVQDDAEGAGRRILARAKSNIGPDDGGYYYDLEQVELQDFAGVWASRVLWGEEIEGSAREILAAADTVTEHNEDGNEDRNEIDKWLRSLLTEEGEISKGDVIKAGRACGFKERAIQYAKKRIGAEAKITGFGKEKVSVWSLPIRASDYPMHARPEKPLHFCTNEDEGSNRAIVQSNSGLKESCTDDCTNDEEEADEWL